MGSDSDVTRWVFVDDTSSQIRYAEGAPWTSWTVEQNANVPLVDGGQLTEVGGQTYATAHYLEGELGQLSFSFTGALTFC